MDENIVLLSDHFWYAVADKEQAQKFVNQHKYRYGISMYYGIYIDKCGYQTILFKEEEK